MAPIVEDAGYETEKQEDDIPDYPDTACTADRFRISPIVSRATIELNPVTGEVLTMSLHHEDGSPANSHELPISDMSEASHHAEYLANTMFSPPVRLDMMANQIIEWCYAMKNSSCKCTAELTSLITALDKLAFDIHCDSRLLQMEWRIVNSYRTVANKTCTKCTSHRSYSYIPEISFLRSKLRSSDESVPVLTTEIIADEMSLTCDEDMVTDDESENRSDKMSISRDRYIRRRQAQWTEKSSSTPFMCSPPYHPCSCTIPECSMDSSN